MQTQIEVSLWNVIKFLFISFILSPLLELAAAYINAAYYGYKVKRNMSLRIRSTRIGLAGMHHEIDMDSKWWRLKTFFVVLLSGMVYLPLEYGSGSREVAKEGMIEANVNFGIPRNSSKLINVFQPMDEQGECLNVSTEIPMLRYATLQATDKHMISNAWNKTRQDKNVTISVDNDEFSCVPRKSFHRSGRGLKLTLYQCNRESSEDVFTIYQSRGIPVALMSEKWGLCDVETSTCYETWETSDKDVAASFVFVNIQDRMYSHQRRLELQVILGLGNMVEITDLGHAKLNGGGYVEQRRLDLVGDIHYFGREQCNKKSSMKVPVVKSNLTYVVSQESCPYSECGTTKGSKDLKLKPIGHDDDDLYGLIRNRKALVPFRYGRRRNELRGYCGSSTLLARERSSEIYVHSSSLALSRFWHTFSCKKTCTIEDFGRLVIALGHSELATIGGNHIAPSEIVSNGTEPNEIVVVSERAMPVKATKEVIQEGTVEVWAVAYYFSLAGAALMIWGGLWFYERNGGLCISVERVYWSSIMAITSRNCIPVPHGPPRVSLQENEKDGSYEVISKYDDFLH